MRERVRERERDETIYSIQQFRTEDVNYREIEFDSYLYSAESQEVIVDSHVFNI